MTAGTAERRDAAMTSGAAERRNAAMTSGAADGADAADTAKTAGCARLTGAATGSSVTRNPAGASGTAGAHRAAAGGSACADRTTRAGIRSARRAVRASERCEHRARNEQSEKGLRGRPQVKKGFTLCPERPAGQFPSGKLKPDLLCRRSHQHDAEESMHPDTLASPLARGAGRVRSVRLFQRRSPWGIVLSQQSTGGDL